MFEQTLRIVFSLIVVFALMWGIAKVIRRPMAGRGGDLMAVVARQQLTKGASVAVVRVGEQTLVVGVTDNQVTLLGNADLAALEAPQAAAPVRRSPVHLVTDPAEELPAVAVGGGSRLAGSAGGRFSGSALSPQTWTQTIEFLRARTVRK